MDRGKEIETIDDNKFDKGKHHSVYVGAEYAINRSEILDMLAEFQNMGVGRSGSTDMPKTGIKLIEPYVRPINPAPFHAGLTAREFAKVEIDKRLPIKVTLPAQSECASTIAFAPKIDGLLRF